ncbi:arginine N-succinyltransferase [Endozoicomonas sp. OPT23]|uniref:arginine N-succinyltransferase n=1 Tax=Endozoicomonas sp. OPT23 TaxID=2072845 RepID=UPI00129A62EC|nr:arginine N-succinyltransferase [Endozoicomonas sp. OPT23]MRI33484.1 arginine N-succinyltransferase [Endozoicomonas sp. OPT23]
MKIVRPVTYSDLAALEALAESASDSMTTLPASREHLQELINNTQISLSKSVDLAGDESYHFVLEDTLTKSILGISGIVACLGMTTPFYTFRIDEEVHASEDLQIVNRMTALKLCQDYTGYTSLCTLFLAPEHDSAENMQLLSRARLLFIAEHRDRFAERILAEIQGVVDEENRSPFWESLGNHFLSMEMSRANYLTGIQEKSFIADLMPRYPIYTRLLPKKARAVIGEHRPDREPVLNLLEQEGFSYQGYVDIFDAGPTLEGGIDRLTTIRENALILVTAGEDCIKESCLVSNQSLEDFRCLLTFCNPEQPVLAPQQLNQLQLADGNSARLTASYLRN